MAADLAATTTWKRRLLACALIGMLGCFGAMYLNRESSPWVGFDLRVDATRNVVVSDVDQNGPAWNAGLRPGDVVALKEMDIKERIMLAAQIAPSVQQLHLSVPVMRNGAERRIFFDVRSSGFTTAATLFANYFVMCGDLLMLVVALLIGLRKPESRDVRDICAVLLTYAVGNSFWNIILNSTPILVTALVANLGAVLSALLFGRYAMRFVPDARVQRVATVVGGVVLLTACILTLLMLTGAASSNALAFALSRSWQTAYFFSEKSHYFFPRLFALICGFYAIAVSRGTDRQRIAWATGAVSILYGTAVIVQPLVRVGILPVSVNEPILDVGVLLFPIGLAYAVLKRRILDVAFVINRAAVFSGVSVIVVGVFVLLEWALSEWFKSDSRTTNVAISGGLALVLGFSIRAIHRHVEHSLDTVFFRKRHEDEQAIRTFAHEAAYITDVSTLTARTQDTLETHADAAFVTLALYDGVGLYGSVSENDAAIVALRAARHTVDLHTLRTALDGEFAYPMIARGRLLGALVIGPKRSGEPYSPDESDAIAQLAHSVGGALDILSVKSGVSLETVSEQLRDLRDTLVQELRSLGTLR